ncbi:GNAT family N-acetyltransferase [Yoonia sp. BS5-3]|uniref:N-acetyltransferase family protein n=1 Tax=Yoonia phaeophyticola TaxID=3137369 RepID=A0ABZ2V107_9RHOB
MDLGTGAAGFRYHARPARSGLLIPKGGIIRRARPADADALAQLHVDIWRETYRNIAPAAAYQALDKPARLPYWRNALNAKDADIGALVALEDSRIIGVASFAPATHPAMNGGYEIKHFYIDRTARRTGLGKRLLRATFAEIGKSRVSLAVVTQNMAARQFYKAMGGIEAGTFTDPGPLWQSSNVIVTWDLRNE